MGGDARRKNGRCRIRKERKNRKRKSYEGRWRVWGGKRKGSHMGRETTISRVPESCRTSTIDIEYCICSEDVETQNGNPRLNSIE